MTPKEHELEIVEEWVLEKFGEERPDIVSCMIKPDFLITEAKLTNYTAFKTEIDLGIVNKKVKVDGEWEEQMATIEDVMSAIGCFNRPYRVDDLPFTIKGILLKTHCPLDGHCYADAYGEE